MFFKQSVLKKLFKNAYKGVGLTVGHQKEEKDGEVIREGYYVAGGFWVIWVDAEHITKEIKAAIIELCGDLPKPGTVFRAYKDAGNQVEIEQLNVYNLPEKYAKSKLAFKVSKIVFKDSREVSNRLLQAEDGTNHVTAINEVFMELIDKKAIDTEAGEWEPDGPLGDCAMSNYVIWGNNTSYLLACIRKHEDEEVVDFFKHLELTEII